MLEKALDRFAADAGASSGGQREARRTPPVLGDPNKTEAKDFIVYLSRILLNYDKGSRTWWQTEAGEELTCAMTHT